MSVLTLPSDPAPRISAPRLVTARREASPPFGGGRTRSARLGSRWAFDITYPVMSYAESLAFTDLEEEVGVIRVPLVQPGIDMSGAGASPLVDGGGQLGNALQVKGLNNGVTIPKGVWMTVEIAGQGFTYRVRQAVTVSGSTALIPVRPLIRRSPPNNAVVKLADPYVEGLPDLDPNAFQCEPGGFVPSIRFTIEEAE